MRRVVLSGGFGVSLLVKLTEKEEARWGLRGLLAGLVESLLNIFIIIFGKTVTRYPKYRQYFIVDCFYCVWCSYPRSLVKVAN